MKNQPTASTSFLNELILEFKNAYRYRNVSFAFVKTNLKQKYRRSFLGYAWSLLSPILQYGLLSWVFSYTMKSSDIPNYFVYTFFGALTYNIFAVTFHQATQVMISNEHYIKKIYVPKSIFVMNLVAYELANFSLSFLGLFILGTLLGKIHYSAALLFIPVALVLIFFFTFGIAAMISVFSVFFRDLLFVIPVIMQAFLFLTPIYYQVEHAPRLVIILSKYNPFLQYIELIRQPLWAQTLPSIKILIGTLFCSFLFFTLGMVILKKFDNKIIFRL